MPRRATVDVYKIEELEGVALKRATNHYSDQVSKIFLHMCNEFFADHLKNYGLQLNPIEMSVVVPAGITGLDTPHEMIKDRTHMVDVHITAEGEPLLNFIHNACKEHYKQKLFDIDEALSDLNSLYYLHFVTSPGSYKLIGVPLLKGMSENGGKICKAVSRQVHELMLSSEDCFIDMVKEFYSRPNIYRLATSGDPRVKKMEFLNDGTPWEFRNNEVHTVA